MSSGWSVGISTCSTPAFAGAGSSEEGLAGHRAVEHHRRVEAVEPGHLGAGAGLVDENELIGIDEGLRRAPDPTPRRDVRTVLFGGAERLFLNDRPRRSTADHIAPLLNRTPCLDESQDCNAAKVRSGRAVIWLARAASCPGVSLRGR